MKRKRNGKIYLSLLSVLALLLIMAAGVFAAEADAEQSVSTGKTFSAVLQDEVEEKNAAEDNDALLEQYLEVNLNISNPAKNAEMPPRYKLSGRDYQIYCGLLEQIRLIASGEQSSAIITLSAEQMGITDIRWTAKDLGVPSIIEEVLVPSPDDPDEMVTKKTIPEDVQRVILKKTLSLETIVNTLLVECPYELYWYDKTAGCALTSLGIRARYDSSIREYVIGFASGGTFAFHVSPDYQGGEDYTVDSGKTEAVATAIENAKQIAADYAGYGDYEKLKAFKDAICGLVSYNRNASPDDGYYGDPWQIIYVFDKDPDTNVVCEGYAKAFQYLCDMSTFESWPFACRLVSGEMTGAGPHMWNVITMEDGENYHVDITNCDEKTIGYPEKLFLAALPEEEEMEDITAFYTVYAGSVSASYQYDGDTLSVYEEEELRIGSGPYGSRKALSKITLREKTANYTGKPVCIDPAEVLGSSGAIRYSYYADAACSRPCSVPSDAGTYYVQAEVEEDEQFQAAESNVVTLKINPVKSPFTAKGKTITLKASKVKKKTQKLKQSKGFRISKAKGTVTYKKKSGNKKIRIASDGRITVKKGLKKGTYRVKVYVTDSGNRNHTKVRQTVTIKIKIRK